jgi:clan AA aspartic protease
MIGGAVNLGWEAIVPIRLRGPGGVERDVDALVDSGFTGSLALPAAEVTALGLTPQSGSQAMLADGTVRQFDVYAAEVAWGNGWRPVLVLGAGDEVLLGMRLMAGHELRIAVVPGGAVEIRPSP